MKVTKYIIPIMICALLASIDQLTKYIIVHNFMLYETKPLINGVFQLNYIRNTGSAWGMLSGKIPFLLIITAIVIAAIFYIYHNISDYKRYNPLKYSLIILLGGAIGNLIDRIRLGYVVDFFDFCLINFPVFNVADIFITVSMGLIIILFIFKYRGDDLDVILGDKLINEAGEFVEKKKKDEAYKELAEKDKSAEKIDVPAENDKDAE